MDETSAQPQMAGAGGIGIFLRKCRLPHSPLGPRAAHSLDAQPQSVREGRSRPLLFWALPSRAHFPQSPRLAVPPLCPLGRVSCGKCSCRTCLLCVCPFRQIVLGFQGSPLESEKTYGSLPLPRGACISSATQEPREHPACWVLCGGRVHTADSGRDLLSVKHSPMGSVSRASALDSARQGTRAA